MDYSTEIDSGDAWVRLRSKSYGRLAVSLDGQPDIFPVNFLANDTSILIRTRAGTKVDRIVANSLVAFETDDAEGDTAWSVVVKGNAHVIDEAAALETASHSPLWAWAPGEQNLYLRIQPTEVTGRMFTRR